MSTGPSSRRILSLDQFRGYTVAGMFLVNFLGGLQITHHVLKHNNDHFSYADSIMPSFLFICGYSYRMTILRRLPELGWSRSAVRFVRRSLALLLFSLMLNGFNDAIGTSRASAESIIAFIALIFKANLWEILAIIGAVQLLLLPVVAAGSRVRVAALVLCAVLHTVLSWWFNYDFVYGRPNWMDSYWGTVGERAWDGGFFGLISWAEVMLAGTLAYDVMTRHRPAAAAVRLIGWGIFFLVLGYGLSCLSTLYDTRGAPGTEKFAVSPVWPPFDRAAGRGFKTLLATPPFVPPPPPEERPRNYWMMDKRVVTQPFIIFGSGFAFALYGLFVLACDVGRLDIGVFRTFGQNPLAAFVIHFLVERSILNAVPKDAPLWWALTGLTAFFLITYFFVRFLEKHGLYLRL
jgi:predicted acyltransferase